MTSQKQTDANRRNALLSTGPRTEEGKQQSRQNAVRHGLTAETVITEIEDADAYEAFETEILSEYKPESLVERELTLRLASLHWRLRRASLIETGLLEICCGPRSDGRSSTPFSSHGPATHVFQKWLGQNFEHSHRYNLNQDRRDRAKNGQWNETLEGVDYGVAKKKRITRSFMELAELPSSPLERITRYEAALWRQFVQTLFALDEAKRRHLIASSHRFRPHPPQW